LRSTFLGAF